MLVVSSECLARGCVGFDARLFFWSSLACSDVWPVVGAPPWSLTFDACVPFWASDWRSGSGDWRPGWGADMFVDWGAVRLWLRCWREGERGEAERAGAVVGARTLCGGVGAVCWLVANS